MSGPLTSPRFWKYSIGGVFYALLAFGLWRYVGALDFAQLRSATVDPLWLGAAILTSLVVKSGYPLVWRCLLRGMGVTIPKGPRLFQVYLTSWLGRYTPGKAAMIGARLVYAERVGARKSQALVSFIVEQIVQISVGAGVGLALLVVAGRIPLPIWSAVLIVAGVIGGWIITSPPVLHRAIDVVFRALRREPLEVFPDQRSIRQAASLHVLIQIGFGVYTLFVAAALSGHQPTWNLSFAAHLWGSFALAVIGGMLTVFAPAGLGAREALQLLLLQPVLTPESAALLILLHRIVEIGTDLLLFAGVHAVRSKSGKPEPLRTPSELRDT